MAQARDDRYLRVILLTDGATVHNAFFDRSRICNLFLYIFVGKLLWLMHVARFSEPVSV